MSKTITQIIAVSALIGFMITSMMYQELSDRYMRNIAKVCVIGETK